MVAMARRPPDSPLLSNVLASSVGSGQLQRSSRASPVVPSASPGTTPVPGERNVSSGSTLGAGYLLRSGGGATGGLKASTASRGSRSTGTTGTAPTTPSSSSTVPWESQRGHGEVPAFGTPVPDGQSVSTPVLRRQQQLQQPGVSPPATGASSPVPLGALAARAAPHLVGAEPLRGPENKQTETLVNALKLPRGSLSPTRAAVPLPNGGSPSLPAATAVPVDGSSREQHQRQEQVPRTPVQSRATASVPLFAQASQLASSLKPSLVKSREEFARSAHAPSSSNSRGRSPLEGARVGHTSSTKSTTSSPTSLQMPAEPRKDQALLYRHLATTLQEDEVVKSQARHGSVRAHRASAPAKTDVRRGKSASASFRNERHSEVTRLNSFGGAVGSTLPYNFGGGDVQERQDVLVDPQFKVNFALPKPADAPWPPGQPPLLLEPSVPPPFYWVPCVETVAEFEVGGTHGEVVTKVGDFEDPTCVLPVTGTLRMAKGGLYCWTLQVVRQCSHRPQLQFGLSGLNHGLPWRFVSTGRCARSRDDGPWVARAAGDVSIVEGDYIHCEVDLRGLVPLGTFTYAVNDGPWETPFEDLPITAGPFIPVVAMGGGGTACRLVGGVP